MFPALLAGTMVGVIAFAPGQTVEYTGDLFWIIMIALLFSWILAMIITPLTCYWLFPDRMKQAEDAKEGVFSIKYKQLMRWSLRSRKIVIGVVLSLFVLSIWGTQFMSQGFFPQSTKVILFVRTVFRQD
ncbi:MAG: hypothetical protein COB14_04265 [Alphaproteobacteria bacterium]|nr:MAG: hypothetical protein COB14_04265 [Alphaproteobacteria bacterium]